MTMTIVTAVESEMSTCQSLLQELYPPEKNTACYDSICLSHKISSTCSLFLFELAIFLSTVDDTPPFEVQLSDLEESEFEFVDNGMMLMKILPESVCKEERKKMFQEGKWNLGKMKSKCVERL